MSKKRIVIVGGGFAGVKCARILRKRLPLDAAEIVLFNRENHMVFHPMLAEVAGGSLNPEAIAAPLRMMLPRVRCRTEDVIDVDTKTNEVRYESHNGIVSALSYDHVVLACGNVTNLGMVPGMADHAFPLKTIGDAMALRSHVMRQLEKAEVCDDPEKRRWYLSFVIVGGGYSGVEAAGEINDLARGARRFFHNIALQDISVTIVHSRDHLLPEIGEKLRDFTKVKMEAAGIDVLLNARCAVATPEGVGLGDGRFLRGATVVCTIGSTPSPVVLRMEAPKEKGRLKTEPDMRVQTLTNVWAIGDCAEITNAYDNKLSPPTGQFAEREGRQCADNIVRVLRGEPTKPFSFKVLGQLCAIGGHRAVAELMGMHFSGVFAWFLWRGIYLMKLPSWARRVKVGFDWAWQIVFSRDLTHLRANETERVAHSYYQAGDWIFQQGEPATNFFVIDKGEVDVVRRGKDGAPDEVLAVLGPGDFFGEMALLSNQPRNASVRARTAVEVVVMGRNVFTQVSSALAPLKSLLTGAVSRRTANMWSQVPIARKLLEETPLVEFMEAACHDPLSPSSTFADAINRLARDGAEFCCVVDDKNALAGLVTRTDLFRGIEQGARRGTHVKDFMTRNPIVVSAKDSTLLAVSTMREHGLKWIPVVDDLKGRRMQGFVRSQKIVQRVLESAPEEAAVIP
jgi:NADH:ubiquinone reductase (H+-translocating)